MHYGIERKEKNSLRHEPFQSCREAWLMGSEHSLNLDAYLHACMASTPFAFDCVPPPGLC